MSSCPLSVLAVGEKVPEPQRTILLMALLGIVLLGLFLVVVILLGGNWVRRIGSYRRGPAIPPDREPLNRRDRDDASRAETGDAIVILDDPPLDSDSQRDTHNDRRDGLGETRVD